MSKDPAFLFYPGDWLGGTMTFSRANKGAYMDLLMCQFNNGHMSEDDVRIVLGSDFDAMWESKLKKKFKIDGDGCYYSKKLEDEQLRRKNFTESRRSNVQGKQHMTKHMKHHMTSHMETETETETRSDTGVKKDRGVGKGKHVLLNPPSLEDVRAYCLERQNKIDPQAFLDHYTTNGWVQGRGKHIVDWKACVRTWEKPQAPGQKKRPAQFLILEYRALKWQDVDIKERLTIQKYSEHEIEEGFYHVNKESKG